MYIFIYIYIYIYIWAPRQWWASSRTATETLMRWCDLTFTRYCHYQYRMLNENRGGGGKLDIAQYSLQNAMWGGCDKMRC